jgi:hypothetical protein
MAKRYQIAWFIFIAFCLALSTGCTGPFQTSNMPTNTPTPTSVPLATWIAEGVPEDLVISYSSSGLAGTHSVTINADGIVSSTLMVLDWTGSLAANGTSEISQDELKQILHTFSNANFFSLCVFD